MKKILIKMVNIYKCLPLESHLYCRHIPTCSTYMIDALNEHGSLKGSYLGIKRILKCRPGGTYGIDLVPPKKEKK